MIKVLGIKDSNITWAAEVQMRGNRKNRRDVINIMPIPVFLYDSNNQKKWGIYHRCLCAL